MREVDRVTDENGETGSRHEVLPTRRSRRAAEQGAEQAAVARSSAVAQEPAAQPPVAQPPVAQNPVAQPPVVQAGAVRPALRVTAPRHPAGRVPTASATPTPPVRRRGARAVRGAVSAAAVATIAGLVAVMALPAHSVDPLADSQAAAEVAARLRAEGVQQLTVAASAENDAAIRDSFSAPTQQQLDEAAAQARALAEAAAAAEKAAREAAEAAAAATSTPTPGATAGAAGSAAGRSGTSSSVTPRAEGDDYPWRDQLTDDEGGGLSPLRYYYRECVDFVAWRLNRDQGSTGAPFLWTWGDLTPGGGSAYAWAGQWAAKGRTTSTVPVPGSVAWFTGNHVAYVQAVNSDGTVALEEYNWGNDHSYHTRTIPASSVPLFLYPPS